MANDASSGSSSGSMLPNARALKKYQYASFVRNPTLRVLVVPNLTILSDRLQIMTLVTPFVVDVANLVDAEHQS